MKAILRCGTGLLSLLLLCTTSSARDWITPVYKTPYPVAPSPSNSGYYYVDGYGRLSGPHYYLVPPNPPFNGHLPGPIGQAIMAGNLPHTLLMNKEAMSIGNAPLLGQKKGHGAAPGHHGAEMPQMASNGPMPYPMGGGGPMPYPMAGMGGPMPYPMPGMAPPMGSASMQTPYGHLPTTPYAQQPPYYQPMPPYGGGVPYTMPYAPMPQARPMAYLPYYGQPGMYANARQDPRTGVWQVQNVMPGKGATPFMPIPGFAPVMPGVPTMPVMPNVPMTPGPGIDPFTQFQNFGPMEQFDPFSRMQGPQPPQMNWQGMQLPRMDSPGPPPANPGGNMFPTHPFTRSPRDFFMWGENMDDERARGNRPLPVP